MIDNITFMAAFWNEEPRVYNLLEYMTQFKNWAIVVQESSDNTLEIVTEFETPTRKVFTDIHRGVGEASFPELITHVPTDWTFVVSGDEWPEQGLLDALPEAVAKAESQGNDGVWLRMRSWIEEFEFTGEDDAHLRLFKTSLGWPSTMHSRPMTDNTYFLDIPSAILHKRTLDEMMIDYLRYYNMGKHNPQWKAHNTVMMHDACEAIAERKGWDFVQTKPWWDEVAKIAF